jgi:hypothetical protein
MPNFCKVALFFLFQPFISLSQTPIIGQLIDEATQNPLPYVNIGLIDENIGTVSDRQGYFELLLNPAQHKNATLQFSMLGYETQTFDLEEFLELDHFLIALKEKPTELDEVIIETQARKFESKILGNKTTSKALYAAFTTNKLGNEMGFIVRQRKHPMILKKFNLSLVKNSYGPIRFRLNFYSVENGLPAAPLLNENIIIETAIESGLITKDLSPYALVIDQDFFIAIEWIEEMGPGDLFFSGGFFGAPLIAREVSQGKWSKVSAASVGMTVEVRY